ncbi:MAG TPA: sulfite exporter TauE/SafE family protein [Flavobacteriales bacterium]|nr:sulfite exporter TauE/SafE family protein [Flavobacteriales bacterium]
MSEIHYLIDTLINYWPIIVLFFIIAILYASVGFGGGSSYLTVLALTPLPFVQIRAMALLCNITVVSGSSYLYIKKHLLDRDKVLPLVIMSIPMAFIGGYLKINQQVFYVLLGFTLLIAAIFMWQNNQFIQRKAIMTSKYTLWHNLVIGGLVGFISGMVGIGGGIFLAPILYLTNWDTPKKIAATSSFFILVNSLAGLAGQILNPDFSINPYLSFWLIISVLIGGQLGSRLSLAFLMPNQLKKVTAVLIAFVAVRLLWKYLL